MTTRCAHAPAHAPAHGPAHIPVHIAAALLVCGGLVGCQVSASAEAELEEVAAVETPDDGSPGIVTLSAAADERLGIATTPVEETSAGLVVPYAALIYDTDGSSWVFVQLEELTYQRAPVTVEDKDGEDLVLGTGPDAGTPVVTVGAAELVGVETGIDGEE
jgi:hypothetical protein